MFGDGKLRLSYYIRFGLAIWVSGWLLACSDAPPADAPLPDPIPIVVETAQRITENVAVDVSGTVVSKDNPARVAFQVAGKVLEVAPREGESVSIGQKLAAMDPTDYELAVKAAEAQVAQARVGLDQSADEYERMRYLFERKSLAPNDFEKFEAKWRLAKAKLEEARAGLSIRKKQFSDTTLRAPIGGFITPAPGRAGANRSGRHAGVRDRHPGSG